MSTGPRRRTAASRRWRAGHVVPPGGRPSLRSTVTRWLAGRSSYLYAPGDMRRAYRWTRDALLALAAVVGLVLLGRLVLTTLFVTQVSGAPPLVAAFNLGLTVAATATVAGLALARRRIRRWWRHRRAPTGAPPPARL